MHRFYVFCIASAICGFNPFSLNPIAKLFKMPRTLQQWQLVTRIDTKGVLLCNLHQSEVCLHSPSANYSVTIPQAIFVALPTNE
jgi:hypothetical protein